MPFGSTMNTALTICLLLAAKLEPGKKQAYFLTKDILEFSGEESQENGPVGTKKTGQEE